MIAPQHQKIILGFVGPMVSGKGTACEYLVKKHSAGTTRFSTILRDILSILSLERSRGNLQKLSSVLRENFGQDVLAKAVAENAKSLKNTVVAVDGIRRLPDILHLKNIPGFYLVSIDADEKIRYERIIKRSENSDDAKKTFEEFQRDNEQEAEQQLREVQKNAKFHINNNGTLEEMYGQIDGILKKIHESQNQTD